MTMPIMITSNAAASKLSSSARLRSVYARIDRAAPRRPRNGWTRSARKRSNSRWPQETIPSRSKASSLPCCPPAVVDGRDDAPELRARRVVAVCCGAPPKLPEVVGLPCLHLRPSPSRPVHKIIVIPLSRISVEQFFHAQAENVGDLLQ